MGALLFALIVVALHLAVRLQRARDTEALRRHAAKVAIRQEMELDRWSHPGEMHVTDRPVGKPLRLVSRRTPVMFRRER